jgi:hypothetical protein
VPTNAKPIKDLKPGMGIYQVLHWPKEAIKAGYPNKPWAVVNLQTGSAEGRYHETKEKALKQARALYAKLGEKAKVHSEEKIHNAFFCFADPAMLLSKDGVRWVEAIAPKTYITPAYGEVAITPEKIDRFIHNFSAGVRGQEVAINYEHGVDAAKGNKAAGWIRGARKNDKGNLELAVDFTEPAKQELRNKEWKYFSLEWDDEWAHPDGVIYQDVVMGGALTNRPVAKGLMPINFSEIFTEKEQLDLKIQNGLHFQKDGDEPSAEQKDLEHSEPGSGTPPTPRTDEDGSDDAAIDGGWRRESPPIVKELEDVMKFSETQAMSYLDAAAKSLNSYIAAEPDYYDKASANSIISQIYNLCARNQSDSTYASSHMSEVHELAKQAHKQLLQIWPKLEDTTTIPIVFTEVEAEGYLRSAKSGLTRIHTNAADALIDHIDDMLAQDKRTRSFNELKALVGEVRAMLRGEDSIDVTTPETTTLSEGGTTVGELTEKDLRELRNVLDVDDDGKIAEAVKVKFGELEQLRNAVSASEQERIFAEQYPQFYDEHRKLMERDRKNTARNFSESVEKIRKAEGYGYKETRQGLSVACKEKVIDAHMKFSEGKGTLADFEDIIKAIVNGGIVQFGEIGSGADDDLPEIDTTGATGIAAARKVFAEVVGKIQRDNPEMSLMEASAEAAKKHPDLAEAYQVALPA